MSSEKNLRIFLSYRRADSISISGRIYDRLANVFGENNVFKDVDTIPVGVDFRTTIEEAINTCTVLLVVIGPSWTTITDSNDLRRLDNPGDVVRIEIETGLNNPNLLVIPVLVAGALVPQEDDLPNSLRPLRSLNSAVIREDPDFNRDMTRFIDQIERFTRLAVWENPNLNFGRRVAFPQASTPKASTERAVPYELISRRVRAFWLILGAVLLWLFWQTINPPIPSEFSNRTSIDLIAQWVVDGNVTSIMVKGDRYVFIELRTGASVNYYKEPETDFIALLGRFGVTAEELLHVGFSEQPADLNLNLALFGGIIIILMTWVTYRVWVMSAREHAR